MSIKLAIVGLGNCASSLIQGIEYYRNSPDNVIGVMHQKIGDYAISDIQIVAAFDINPGKVGKDVSEAIWAAPNCTKKISDVPHKGVTVVQGNRLDGVCAATAESFGCDPKAPVEWQDEAHDRIVAALKESGAEILLSYLPVGSARASRFYAQCAIDAGCGFINAIPEFICSDPEWQQKFINAGLPCAGDDIKSQVGATIVHRVLASLIENRGQVIDNTYQLNIGGNTDFLNMTDESRLVSKRISKTQAVTSICSVSKENVRIGPSDYVPHLQDNKICYINFKGRQFGDIPFELDLKLSVEDSPNSAGVMVDAIRCMKLALDNKVSGVLIGPSSYFFKSPPEQFPDAEAHALVEDFIAHHTVE